MTSAGVVQALQQAQERAPDYCYTAAQVYDLLGIGSGHLNRLVKQGQMRCLRVMVKHFLYHREDVAVFVERRHQQQAQVVAVE